MPFNGDEVRETSSVAAEVISEIESAGAGEETVRETTDTKTAETPKPETKADDTTKGEKKPEAKADADDDDDFDKVPAEIDDPNPRNKGKKVENKLPHSRVKKMVEKARKAMREAADAEWKAKHEPLETELTSVREAIAGLNQLAMTDPDGFLAELAKNMPIYKEFVRQAKREEAKADDDPEPQPDVPNDKGEMVGYSISQAKKLMSWTARQEVKGVKKELEPTVAAVRSSQQTAEDQRKQAALEAQYEASATQQLEEAQKWPGYKEHEAEIQKTFLENKKLRLYDAYISVVVPKLQRAATDARATVLEELKTAPVDTSIGRAAAPEKDTEKPQSTEDIARQVIREMEAATR